MNELNRALGDIRNIRKQVAQHTEFRGYGPLTLCATAAFAVVGGFVQAAWIPQPVSHPLQYVILWSFVAILSAFLMAIETLRRAHRIHSGIANEMLRMAAEQFLPAIVAGTLLTGVLLHSDGNIVWMLPGLWQLIYSLGVFSSCRFLPKPMLAAGVWYLASGLTCIGLGDSRTLSPVLMAGAFSIGQLMVACILFSTAKESVDAE